MQNWRLATCLIMYAAFVLSPEQLCVQLSAMIAQPHSHVAYVSASLTHTIEINGHLALYHPGQIWQI